ncbi:hypothetical protein [Halalkalibacter alkalisediminis]|uniref:Uncharacterized protein n=1 Tax=Halalkalibacter alkalisediminis TaxID=935616 RepID=A0ABV6NGT7_9BACI|nr:hypothetical protein [Halalkalibacter alkalisediminis]
MFTVVITISLSIFFLLFFGVMMLGNKMSQTIEYLQAKAADEELAYIDEMMSKYEQDEQVKRK